MRPGTGEPVGSWAMGPSQQRCRRWGRALTGVGVICVLGLTTSGLVGRGVGGRAGLAANRAVVRIPGVGDDAVGDPADRRDRVAVAESDAELVCPAAARDDAAVPAGLVGAGGGFGALRCGVLDGAVRD